LVGGSIELHGVLDAVGLLGDYEELYPDVPSESWEPYRTLYPELFAGETWRPLCTCFLVRSAGTTILVDTGTGPPGLWDWTAEEEGLLPDGLAALGVARDDIDVVFLTHLHIDHLGWNTDLDGNVFFPRARSGVHADALAFARTQADRPHIRRCVEPLLDRFELATGDMELAPGVTAFPAPGHYPGHVALRLESEGESALLIADSAVHPALLDEPDWVYVFDGDPKVCVETRRWLLPELVDRDVSLPVATIPAADRPRRHS
jgi:glyoxylase-like metal-dependent hydrolase (beta-lactamase superfamily II)